METLHLLKLADSGFVKGVHSVERRLAHCFLVVSKNQSSELFPLEKVLAQEFLLGHRQHLDSLRGFVFLGSAVLSEQGRVWRGMLGLWIFDLTDEGLADHVVVQKAIRRVQALSTAAFKVGFGRSLKIIEPVFWRRLLLSYLHFYPELLLVLKHLVVALGQSAPDFQLVLLLASLFLGLKLVLLEDGVEQVLAGLLVSVEDVFVDQELNLLFGEVVQQFPHFVVHP